MLVGLEGLFMKEPPFHGQASLGKLQGAPGHPVFVEYKVFVNIRQVAMSKSIRYLLDVCTVPEHVCCKGLSCDVESGSFDIPLSKCLIQGLDACISGQSAVWRFGPDEELSAICCRAFLQYILGNCISNWCRHREYKLLFRLLLPERQGWPVPVNIVDGQFHNIYTAHTHPVTELYHCLSSKGKGTAALFIQNPLQPVLLIRRQSLHHMFSFGKRTGKGEKEKRVLQQPLFSEMLQELSDSGVVCILSCKCLMDVGCIEVLDHRNCDFLEVLYPD